jgi:uncharacterized surface anchored protein
LANVDLELQSGDEILLTTTDRNGRFSFADLRPGKWTLTVSNANLPAYHELEHTTYELDIEPGQQPELLVRVLARRRPILIIDEGKVPVVPKSKP